MKLELKHLAPYLPYGLSFSVNLKDVRDNFPDELRTLKLAEISIDLALKTGKPILRPLSSMTEKESDELEDIIGCNFYIYVSGNEIEIEENIIDPWDGKSVLRMETLNRIYEWLFAHHFDVFNLIENNLAINKTEIK